MRVGHLIGEEVVVGPSQEEDLEATFANGVSEVLWVDEKVPVVRAERYDARDVLGGDDELEEALPVPRDGGHYEVAARTDPGAE